MAQINVRIEEKTKKAASKTLAGLGLDMSSAINMFLKQVVEEQGLPFTPTKNAQRLREKWDREVEWALKHGKVYDARDALKGL